MFSALKERRFVWLVIGLLCMTLAVYQNCGTKSKGSYSGDAIVDPGNNYLPPASLPETTSFSFSSTILQNYEDGLGAVSALKLDNLGNFGRGDWIHVQTTSGGFPSGRYRVLSIGRDGKGGESDADDAGHIVNVGVKCTTECSMATGSVRWANPPLNKGFTFTHLVNKNYENHVGLASTLVIPGAADIMVGDRVKIVTTKASIKGTSVDGVFKVLHVELLNKGLNPTTQVDVGLRALCDGSNGCDVDGTLSVVAADTLEVTYDWLGANKYGKLSEDYTYAPHVPINAPMAIGDFVTIQSTSGQVHEGTYRVKNKGADGYDAQDAQWAGTLLGLNLGCPLGYSCGTGTGTIRLSNPPLITYTGSFYNYDFSDDYGDVLAFRTDEATSILPGDQVYIKAESGLSWQLVAKVTHVEKDPEGNLDRLVNVRLRSPCQAAGLSRSVCMGRGYITLMAKPLMLSSGVVADPGQLVPVGGGSSGSNTN